MHPCVHVLRRGRHAGPHGRRAHQAASRICASATRSTAPCGDGSYRRYVDTQVLDHWSTIKPAYRVTLEDGTELVASGDHRFLTDRGWKHVTGAEHGPCQRPHLTLEQRAAWAPAASPTPPDVDATTGAATCADDPRRRAHRLVLVRRGPAGRRDDVHRFRLALTDFEALRARSGYLRGRGVATDEFAFQAAAGATRRSGDPDRARHAWTAIRELDPLAPRAPDDWCKGFLAGHLRRRGHRAAGQRSGSPTPIRQIIDWTADCLRRLGFDHVVEDRASRTG